MTTTPITCKNCGHPVTDKYCGHCGEKIYTDHDKSFAHVLEEGVHFITHFEGSFLGTLKTIFLRPGRYATDYVHGIRKKYFKPISMFLMVVVIYLLFPFAQGLNLSMDMTVQTFRSNGLTVVERAAEAKALKKNISLESLAELYDHKSPKFAKVMLVLLLPMAALVLYLLHSRRKRYFFDHFLLGTELVTHFVLLAFLLVPLLLYLLAVIAQLVTGSGFDYGDNWIGPITLVLLLPSWTIALRTFYKEKTGWAILKSVLFFIGFALLCLFIVYRLIIFFTILLFL